MAAAVSSVFLLLLILLFNTTHAMPTTSNNNLNMKTPPAIPRQILESRLRNSLWSLFAGDALASPTHWYYGGFPHIQRDYGPAGITGYTKPKLHLEGSILNKSDPNGGGRLKTSSASGSLFGFGRNKNNNDKAVTIIGDVINHGKLPYWSPTESYHYHATLQSGENTLEAQLVRVLLKSLVATNGSFSPSHFRQAYVDFMTTAGSHNDTYASTCHRMFFANMVFGGLDPKDCPDNDGHNVDAIDGLILPTVVVLAETVRRLKIDAGSGSIVLEEEAKNAVRTAAAQTASVTRSSKLLERVSEVWADIVMASLLAPTEKDFTTSLTASARQLGLSPPRSDGRDQLTACYLSQSLPSALDMICKYTQQSTKLGGTGLTCWKALLANANVGGENVHRGSLLGAVLGARVGDENGSSLPVELKEGLHHKEEIGKEIDSFVETILGQNGDRRGDAKEEL